MTKMAIGQDHVITQYTLLDRANTLNCLLRAFVAPAGGSALTRQDQDHNKQKLDEFWIKTVSLLPGQG